MIKYLFTLAITVFLMNPFDSSAQQAMYSKEQFETILKGHDEVIMIIEGFDYKYSGSWLNTMEIVGDHTLTFARGKVIHSYDLSKVKMVQEEGGWVKFWMK